MLEVALVVVGDELLSGTRHDRNGPWLAARLDEVGARVVSLRVTGDRAEQVAVAVGEAASQTGVVIVGGGLGPTNDDGTRAGLARVAGTDLVEDPEALAAVRAAQEARGFDLDERRRREALLPRGARCLVNPQGTAPGVEMRVGGAVVWALPGVPREFEAMFEAAVLPKIERLGSLEPPAVDAFRVAGVREPDVADALARLAMDPAVDLGLYPHEGELELRFTARGSGAGKAVGRAVGEARSCLGAAVYGNVPIERAVVEALRCRACTVTTAESMTGGLVARMLTAVPGASDVFRGGWVTYSDVWKERALGVPRDLLDRCGAVSADVARAMAEGAKRRADVDLAVAVTGIAGPGDGTDPLGRPIPEGTCFVALAATGRPTEVHRSRSPLARTAVQRRAAVQALDMLRRALVR